ncbi:unnamed protein product [Prorocentrum cordatum]|uniref:Uncharacterized protein n=1 Tax=Prorocentrum cordatum TaxID=2364126 RepID=A0ABN9UV34_9DINO|nr:unnamed protein product [Polarella glacialis]
MDPAEGAESDGDGADVVTDEGHVKLVYWLGRQAVHHDVTGEVRVLPEPPHEAWKLVFSPDGGAFINSGGTSTWCSELFKFVALQGDPVEVAVACDDTEGEVMRPIPLHSFIASHKVGHVPVPSGPHLQDLRVEVGAFLHLQRGGCRLWWSLNSLWHGFGMTLKTKQQYKTWVYNGFPKWAARVQQLGFPPEHVRKAASGSAEAGADTGPSPFGFTSASTSALIILLVRWSHATCRSEGEWVDGKSSSRDFLDSLLLMLPECFSLRLHLEEQVSDGLAEPPDLVETQIDVRAGIADFSKVWPSNKLTAAPGAKLRELLGFERQAAIPKILGVIWKCTSLQLTFRQLVVGLSANLEHVFCKDDAGGTTHWWGSSLVEFSLGDIGWRQKRSMLYEYWTAGLRHMQTGSTIMSVCVDKSRVGRKDVTLSAAVLPSNRAHWLPPQVRRSTQGG